MEKNTLYGRALETTRQKGEKHLHDITLGPQGRL